LKNKNIVLNSVRMHRYASFQYLLSSSNIKKHCLKLRPNAPLCILLFKNFSAVPFSKDRFILRQTAPLSVLKFKLFSAVPTSKTSIQIADGTV